MVRSGSRTTLEPEALLDDRHGASELGAHSRAALHGPGGEGSVPPLRRADATGRSRLLVFGWRPWIRRDGDRDVVDVRRPPADLGLDGPPGHLPVALPHHPADSARRRTRDPSAVHRRPTRVRAALARGALAARVPRQLSRDRLPRL